MDLGESWDCDPQAAAELQPCLDMFEPEARAPSQLVGNLDFTSDMGQHPEELPRRLAIRALPAVVDKETDLYVLFAETESGKYVVLHVVVVQRPGRRRGRSGPRMPLPGGAWEQAKARLDSGGW